MIKRTEQNNSCLFRKGVGVGIFRDCRMCISGGGKSPTKEPRPLLWAGRDEQAWFRVGPHRGVGEPGGLHFRTALESLSLRI